MTQLVFWRTSLGDRDLNREETYRKGVYQCIAAVLQVRESENQSYGERDG